MRWSSPPAPASEPRPGRSDWATLKTLLPYLLTYKRRVAAALLCLVAAKLATVGVPIVLKHMVDAMVPPREASTAALVVAVPLALILGYGLLRLASSAFNELREFFFVKVTQAAVRTVELKAFKHLLSLSLRFHLERRTGALTREIERGVRGIGSLVSFTLYSIVPTLIELALVLGYLALNYDLWFALIILISLAAYVVFTVSVTSWRTQLRREWNESESRASSRAVDALLNYETVKVFGNEDFEARRYDTLLDASQKTAIRSQQSLNFLNTGQQLIIALGLTAMLWRAAVGVADGRMTVGDLVLVNAFMIQLYIPLNFLGVIYREIKQSMVDMDRLFSLLEEGREVADAPAAAPLQLRGGGLSFDHVSFAYDPRRPVIRDISFTVPAGTTTAVVGATGSGKSTLARLLFRFYDVNSGAIAIDGQDIRSVTQQSLREAIGIVPQDTVLFNDTIGYNIGYGRPGATQEEIEAAARAAHIHDFIAAQPDGYGTLVGERGLKLSGGEKQRVAIARTLLKRPAILVFDEATSALDSRTERGIQAELEAIARHHTTLVIAHRLSTIVNADQILVMEGGRIVERGTHAELLSRAGNYAQMWDLQSRQSDEAATAQMG